MTFEKFHNALRILRSIDPYELERAGLPTKGPDWADFRQDPYRWFIAAPTEKAKVVWTIIEARQPHDDAVYPDALLTDKED